LPTTVHPKDREKQGNPGPGSYTHRSFVSVSREIGASDKFGLGEESSSLISQVSIKIGTARREGTSFYDS
jgi:hypothetical protein